MRSKLVAGLVGVLVCLVLAACGGEPTAGEEAARDEQAAAEQARRDAEAREAPRDATATDGTPCGGSNEMAVKACQNAYDLCRVSGEQAIADEYSGGDIDTAAEGLAEGYRPAIQPVVQAACLSGFKDAR